MDEGWAPNVVELLQVEPFLQRFGGIGIRQVEGSLLHDAVLAVALKSLGVGCTGSITVARTTFIILFEYAVYCV
ncbi:hypothetical protein [Rhizobium leguminosarum]|uniref:Uncharacterized protein n=1 Tax=Rhizobium leguminosarum TaxID=384 RepID=A0A1B1C605_RHILE|nr:hypothetical protein [Rhizobium leguminosarum]ANP85203.1 hypothetical protein BA011_05270 [Rhizobium leguminosarum]